MYGFFAKRTDPPHRPYSSGCPSRPSCLRPPPSPTHSSRRSLGHAVFAALQVLHSGPSTDRASLATSLPLIGLLTPVPPGDPASPPEVTLCSSGPCRPQSPCNGEMDENAFAFVAQARPIPPWADRFIIGVTPIDYGPGLLLMLFRFHLTMDTLPSGVLPIALRPARNDPRFRIWRPSSGRQRDFNPPEQRAAQHTLQGS